MQRNSLPNCDAGVGRGRTVLCLSTTLLLSGSIALACGVAEDANHNGTRYFCQAPSGPYGTEICIQDSVTNENPWLPDAVCRAWCRKEWSNFVDINGQHPKCDEADAEVAYEEHALPTCETPFDWLDYAKDEEMADSGFGCFVQGKYTFVQEWDSPGVPKQWSSPALLDNWYPDSWDLCALGLSGGNTACKQQCVDTVLSIIEISPEDGYGDPVFLLPSNTASFFSTFDAPVPLSDVEAYCEAAVTGAFSSNYVECASEMVLDPTLDDFAWPDGTTAPLDCDINNDCCEGLGVCEEFIAGSEGRRPASRYERTLEGNLTVDYDGLSLSTSITADARWSASDCSSVSGACPFYLGGLEIDAGSLEGDAAGFGFLLRGLEAQLRSPSIGAFRRDTGDLWIPSEAVLLDVYVDDVQTDADGIARRQGAPARVRGGLRGGWQGEELQLSGTYVYGDFSVAVDLRSR